MKYAHMQIYTSSKDSLSSKNNFSLHIMLIFFTLTKFEFNNHYDALIMFQLLMAIGIQRDSIRIVMIQNQAYCASSVMNQACLSDSCISLENLSNCSQQSITAFSSNLEMQPWIQSQQKTAGIQDQTHCANSVMKIQSNSHNDALPQHCIMSEPIAQFFLDDLLKNLLKNNQTLNSEQYKIEIDNMKSSSQWTPHRLCAACKEKSMLIKGSSFAKLNFIIKKHEYAINLMKRKNERSKNCDCLHQIHKKFISKKVIQYIQIKNSHHGRQKFYWMKSDINKSIVIMSKKIAKHKQCSKIKSIVQKCSTEMFNLLVKTRKSDQFRPTQLISEFSLQHHNMISQDVFQFLLEEYNNQKDESKICSIQFNQEWTFDQLYLACKKDSEPIKDSTLESLNTIITQQKEFVQYIRSTKCCFGPLRKILCVIEEGTMQCLQLHSSRCCTRIIKRCHDRKLNMARLCQECFKKASAINRQYHEVIINCATKMKENFYSYHPIQCSVNLNNNSQQNNQVAMSQDVIQFFLDELACNNQGNALKIDQKEHGQKLTLSQLCSMCETQSIHIQKESSLANFNVMIQKQSNLDQRIANMLRDHRNSRCSYLAKIDSRCFYLVNKNKQLMKTKMEQLLQIENSTKGKRLLSDNKSFFKKKINEGMPRIIIKCRQQCHAIAQQIIDDYYIKMFTIAGKMQKFFYLNLRNNDFSHQTQWIEQQQNDSPIQLTSECSSQDLRGLWPYHDVNNLQVSGHSPHMSAYRQQDNNDKDDEDIDDVDIDDMDIDDMDNLQLSMKKLIPVGSFRSYLEIFAGNKLSDAGHETCTYANIHSL